MVRSEGSSQTESEYVGKPNHSHTRQLLGEVDELGTKLKRSEIDFVADLIDRNVQEFTPEEEKRIKRLHREKAKDNDGID